MKTTKEFIDLIKMAIREEKKAQELYKNLAKKAQDPFSRDILEGLYEQEILHEQKLESLLNSIKPSAL